MAEATLVNIGAETPVIRVEGLRKRYGKTSAIDGVGFEARPGEIYGLIGPDGAGKSSLMKAIAGVLTFEQGCVEVFGIPLDSERAAERIKDRIGFMPQGLGLNLYPELSVEENIDFFGRLRLVPETELAARKQHLLVMTRLDKFRDRLMKNLSGGMKQKLGLICTLIHEPDLVILDEPTTGVDPLSRRDFWAILARFLRERGMTALVSTAYMDEASRFHRLSLMYGGRVLAEGDPDRLQSLAPGTVVMAQVEAQVEALARLEARFSQVEALGPWLRAFVETTDPDAALLQVQEVLTGIPILDISARPPELEDIFIALLRKPRQAWQPSAARPSETFAPHILHAEHAAITAQELTRDFGRFRAVENVSFRVLQGQIFGLLGANGAGKTTVIKMLTGILPPSQGRGRIAGTEMNHRAGHDIKQRIGYVSQAFSLYQDLTVLENLNLYAGIYGLSRKETNRRLEQILPMTGLTGQEHNLSGSLPMGLRQRLALGCALIHQPQVLFLDEPTSGVDPIGRRQFWEILFRLSREEGVAILITTHYMSEAEHCDHLALMYAGRIIADASPDELKRQVEAEAGRLLEITTDQPALALERLTEQGFRETALFGRHIHLLSSQAETDLRRVPELLASAHIQVSEITPRPLSMEDVFVYRLSALERQEPATALGAGV